MSPQEVVEYAVWFARKVKGPAADVARSLLEQYPDLRIPLEAAYPAAPSDAPDHLHDPFDPAQDTVWLGALGHSPQPDGRCLHRWKNRAEHVVRCAFLDGYRAALSRPSDAPEKP